MSRSAFALALLAGSLFGLLAAHAQTPWSFTGTSQGNFNPLTASALNAAGSVKQDVIASGNAASVRAALALGPAALLGTNLSGGVPVLDGGGQVPANELGNVVIGSVNVTAAGGTTPRTAASWFGDNVNAIGAGATGNGTTDDFTAMLAASGVAQVAGKSMAVPTPATNYKLGSDWLPAAGDLSLNIAPGVTWSGAGTPHFDNQFIHMVNPIYSPVLNSRTFGSYYAGYGNVLLNANVAINNGAGNTVAVFGEGVSNLSSSHSWGSNPVCVTIVSGATCIGEEIDTWAQVSGTNAYGLAIFMTGHANGLNAIQIGANSSSSVWLNGIDIVGANDNTTSFTNSAITDSTHITANFGLNFLGTYTSAEINTQSLRVAATPATPTARLQIAGGNAGSSVKLSVQPNQGGTASATPLEISSQQSADVFLESGNGKLMDHRDPAGTIANYPYTSAALATGQVVLGNTGTDTDISTNIRLQGAGTLIVQNGNGLIAQFTAPNASTISRLTVQAAAAGGFVNLSVGGTAGNMTLGSGVLATSATTGFVGIPTTSGIPSGTVGAAGAAMIVINNTSHKLCHSEGGGTWFDATGAACS